MRTIHSPLHIPELDLKPEFAGGIQLSDDMQQTLSLLAGFWKHKRLLLRASPSGILMTTDPQLKEVYTVTGSGANDTYQGENVPCSGVLVMGHPDNTGRIWVRPHTTASAANGWPLEAGDVVGFGLTNLNMLHALIVVDGEKLIIAYSE